MKFLKCPSDTISSIFNPKIPHTLWCSRKLPCGRCVKNGGCQVVTIEPAKFDFNCDNCKCRFLCLTTIGEWELANKLKEAL